MNYDITMCANINCKKRLECLRYATHEAYRSDKGNKPPQVSMLLHAADEPVGNDCKLFWQITTKTL